MTLKVELFSVTKLRSWHLKTDENSTIVLATTIAPNPTSFFTTRYFVDNDTYCLNETDVFDVVVNVQEFLTLLIDILTLTPNPTLNLTDVTVGTVVELLQDPLVDDIVEQAFNVTLNDSWVAALYALDLIAADMTLGEVADAFFELELVLQVLRAAETLNRGRVNYTNLNNIIDLVLGNDTNFTLASPAPNTPVPTGEDTQSTVSPAPTTELEDVLVDAADLFGNITSFSDIVDEDGVCVSWLELLVSQIMAFMLRWVEPGLYKRAVPVSGGSRLG